MSDSSTHRLALRARIDYAGFRLDVDEELDLDGVTGLFGPSGGGKSTLLRVIAGLEHNSGGRVIFAGDVWQDERTLLRAHQRPVGFVFQDARLFSHLSVVGNLQFAASRNQDAGVTLAEVETALDLQPLMQRGVDALSGGERQRVAIARTLLTNPRLLLLDEPLAALDVQRKREILPYIESLPDRFGIPVIYVSHSANEMARLTDNVILLEDGKVVANASVNQVVGRDVLSAAAMPFEALSILQVTVVEQIPELHLVRVEHRGQRLTVPAGAPLSQGASLRLLIRSGDVVLATTRPEGLSVRNLLSGTVVELSESKTDAFSSVTVDIDGAQIKAQLTTHAVQELGLVSGTPVFALLKTAAFERIL